MDSIVSLGLLLLTLSLAYLIARSTKKKGRLPPGPPGLPIVGNIHQIYKAPHLELSKWIPKYGKLYSIKLGHRDCIVISDAQMMKDLNSLPEATGKFNTDTLLLLSRGPYGVLNTIGEEWVEQRKFSMDNLKKYGFGQRSSLEPLILSEVQEVIDWLKADMDKNGKIWPLHYLRLATVNTLWTIISGERFNLKDSKLCLLMDDMVKAMNITTRSGLVFLPWLKYIAPEKSGYNALNKATKDIHDFVVSYIEEHRRTFKPGAARDVIDAYIEHLPKITDPKSSFYGQYGEINAVASIVDLFNAGSETTPHQINWLLLWVTHNQRVQRKLHEEIDTVVGRCRQPCLRDARNMPYTEAVINEALRMAFLMPFGVPIDLTDDVEYKGYFFPKGLTMISNMYYIQMDPDVWGDPETFRPERFIDKNGNVTRPLNLVPFQNGKRICLGEPLARDIMFLFVSNIFQTFHLVPDPDDPEPRYEPDVGIGNFAKPYTCVMKVRESVLPPEVS